MNSSKIAILIVTALIAIAGLSLALTGDNKPVETLKTYTLSDVSSHNTKSNCWTVIDSSVYDLTSYVSSHPGGKEILRACGVDGTSLFKSRETSSGEEVGSGNPHSSGATSQLEDLKIGELVR